MTARTIRLQNRFSLALLLSVSIFAGYGICDSALAASSTQAPSTSDSSGNQDGSSFDPQKLSAAEKLYFGSSFEKLSVSDRMDKIERGVFGHNRSGSLSKRFDRVTAALGTEKIVNSETTTQKPDPKPDANSDAKADPKPDNQLEAKSDAKLESKPDPKPDEKVAAVSEKTETKKTPSPEQSTTDVRVQNLLKSGMTAHRSGQIQVAEGQFKAALAIDPRCADAFYNLGSIAESKGDLLAALTNYRAALGINPLDKELQNAVKAVEDDVAKGNTKIGGTASSMMPKVASPFNQSGNHQSASYAGYTPPNYNAPASVDNKLFNLQTAQSNALMQAQGSYPVGNVSQPPIPVYNVSQQNPPIANVNQQKAPSHNNSATNAMVNVLMQASGLHCPICRLRSIGNW